MACNYNPYYYNPNYQPTPYPNGGAVPDVLNQQKIQYQQMPSVPQMSPTPMSPSSNDFLWVLGEVEATSYPVAPNNTVTLWDKNQPTIYIKSANAQGVPSMRILDFTERTANAPQTPTEHQCKCGDRFISKKDFNALQGKYDDILNRLMDIEEKYNSLTTKPTAKTTKKTEAE